jgi:predicted O-methyltransferase YrrM
MPYSLDDYLKPKQFCYEGNCADVDEEVEDLIKLSATPNISIMEIGFNAGHSSEVFLKHNNTSKVVSFDLGEYVSVDFGKDYIDSMYPDRHTLILGDSTQTVPKYILDNSGVKFDLIFIDGGHEYEIAIADIQNCYHLAHKNTIVIVDDVVFTPGWEQHYTVGPTQAWTEYLTSGKITELGRKDYRNGRGIAWGRYLTGL